MFLLVFLFQFVVSQTIRDNFTFDISLKCGSKQPFHSQVSVQELDSDKVDQIIESTFQITTVSQRIFQLNTILLGDELYSDKYDFQLTVKHNCQTNSDLTKVLIFRDGIPIQKSFYSVKVDLDLEHLPTIIVPTVNYYEK